MLAFFLALVATAAFAGALEAEDVVQPLAMEGEDRQVIEGEVNWTDQILTAYGEGIAPEGEQNPVRRRLMGFRAAKTVAYRNLLELVGEVQVDAQTKVSMAMVESDSVRTTVTGLVRGARVAPESQEEDEGLYRLALQLDLRQAFAAAVLPNQGVRPTDSEAQVAPAESVAEDDSAGSAEAFIPPKPRTGLLVDARGLDLQPSMAPQIRSESGYLIYGTGFVGREYASRMGMVGYDKDMDRARASDRLGGEESHPLVVRAARVSGNYSADVVIGDEEAVWVRMADADAGFLAEGRVVFVLGPEPVAVENEDGDSLNVDQAETDYFLPPEDNDELPE